MSMCGRVVWCGRSRGVVKMLEAVGEKPSNALEPWVGRMEPCACACEVDVVGVRDEEDCGGRFSVPGDWLGEGPGELGSVVVLPAGNCESCLVSLMAWVSGSSSLAASVSGPCKLGLGNILRDCPRDRAVCEVTSSECDSGSASSERLWGER